MATAHGSRRCRRISGGDDVKPVLEAVPAGIERRLGDNNIFPTFARHPDLFRAWLPFGGFLLTAGKLSGRDRELLILRTAVRTGSSYEWGQHVRISLDGGMERAAIDRVLEGPDADGWTPHEAALIRAADELHDGPRGSPTPPGRRWRRPSTTSG